MKSYYYCELRCCWLHWKRYEYIVKYNTTTIGCIVSLCIFWSVEIFIPCTHSAIYTKILCTFFCLFIAPRKVFLHLNLYWAATEEKKPPTFSPLWSDSSNGSIKYPTKNERMNMVHMINRKVCMVWKLAMAVNTHAKHTYYNIQ